jgi:ribosomal protein S18 acetylase RimI-like enzyme
MVIRRRNPSVTRDDLLDIWPTVARWVAGASFTAGVDWTRLLAAHEATFARLRRRGPVTAYRAAHGRPDEFRHPSAWTLDRGLAVSLAQDSLRFGPVTDVRVLLTATLAPEDVWFVLPDLQREADEVGAGIVLDSQEWDEVVVKTGAYKLTAADKRALAASKAAWKTINKMKTATDKRNAALAVSRDLYAGAAAVRNPGPARRSSERLMRADASRRRNPSDAFILPPRSAGRSLRDRSVGELLILDMDGGHLVARVSTPAKIAKNILTDDLSADMADRIGSLDCRCVAYLQSVSVDPTVRNRGIGKALMIAALHIAREKGACAAFLFAYPQDDETTPEHLDAFYRSVGMRRVDGIDEEGMDMIFYWFDYRGAVISR